MSLPESKGPAILVVDDEPALRELLQILLMRQLGASFRIVEAEHGAIAVELFEELLSEGFSVPAVVMDVRMPVMDGIEATRRILAAHPDAAIFIATAYAEEGLVQEALAAGAKAVINKALGFAEIALRVSQAARARVAPNASAETR